jgi:hypothetical protein
MMSAPPSLSVVVSAPTMHNNIGDASSPYEHLPITSAHAGGIDALLRLHGHATPSLSAAVASGASHSRNNSSGSVRSTSPTQHRPQPHHHGRSPELKHHRWPSANNNTGSMPAMSISGMGLGLSDDITTPTSSNSAGMILGSVTEEGAPTSPDHVATIPPPLSSSISMDHSTTGGASGRLRRRTMDRAPSLPTRTVPPSLNRAPTLAVPVLPSSVGGGVSASVGGMRARHKRHPSTFGLLRGKSVFVEQDLEVHIRSCAESHPTLHTLYVMV